MRPRNSLMVCLSVLGLFVAEPGFAVPLYALETFANRLYRIDTDALSSPVLIGTIGAGAGPDLSELVRLSDAALYTFDRGANSLLTIAVADGTVLVSVALDLDITPHPRGFDLSPSGMLYGVFAGLQLRTIDSATGQTAFAANLYGATLIEAIAFAPDGALYAVGSDDPPSSIPTDSRRLYGVDLSSGMLSLIADLVVPDIDTLAFGPDGYLYGADSLDGWNADLYRIDPRTGGLAVLGKTGVTGLNGLAVAPSMVPLPAPIWLIGAGFLSYLGLGFSRRT